MHAKTRSAALMILTAVLLDALGIVFLIFFAGRSASSFDRLLGIIASVMLFGISALFWYVLALGLKKSDNNFFLYDRKSRSSMAVSSLTITEVMERLNLYLGMVLSEPRRKGTFLNARMFADMPPEFKVLFPSWFLITCCRENREDLWKVFIDANKPSIDEFARLLFAAGAVDVSRHIPFLRASLSVDTATIRDYLVANRAYLEQSLLLYVMAHIEDYCDRKSGIVNSNSQ